MSIRDINNMCYVVEAFIRIHKSKSVKIDRMAIYNDQRQQQMLIYAYSIAKNK
jgi:hypothetical protein